MPGVRIFGVSLNPGPFSLKEHVVITVMATVGSSSAYAVRLTSAAEIRLFRWRSLTKSCVCVWGGLGTDRDYCGAKKTLWPGLVFCLPVAPRRVYAACRVFIGRRRQALPRVSTIYECVSSDLSYHSLNDASSQFGQRIWSHALFSTHFILRSTRGFAIRE